ncbi:hypothetical protein [Nocardioides bruguierae]|uniref:Uncharacterized protein n=1 Tax=Nocardioides bruguierae TaxID=2945102 RepID=A0A9X2IF46_9ACTN|nr:hypothetical protein [Nocardioides bruguierae]MCM0620019.1 hypothetical protein [Nocardioides bruguierae]
MTNAAVPLAEVTLDPTVDTALDRSPTTLPEAGVGTRLAAMADRPLISVWTRTLAGLGVALVGAGAAWGLALVLGGLNSYAWADDALVPADGSAHEVAVTAGETTRMWTTTGAVPGCRVGDAASGERLALAPSQALTRPAGSSTWTSGGQFVPTSGLVTVACAASGPDVVAIGAGGTVAFDLGDSRTQAPLGLTIIGVALVTMALVLVAAQHQGTAPAPGKRR